MKAGKKVFTKHKIIQKDHGSSDALLDLLVREAKEYAIFQVDLEGLILNWNFGAERMKQFTAREAIGQNYEMLYREEDQKDGRPQTNIRLAVEQGRHEDQWWRKKKDGSIFWADSVMTPIYSPAGELLYLSKIVRDLSAEKRTENELCAAKASAEAASGLKSVFVANMSHEIRTPLGAILGFSEVLKDPECSKKDRLIAADVIDRNGKILLRLIEDILDISKIDAGKLDIEVSEIYLKTILADVVSSFEGRAHDKGLLLKIKNDREAPDKVHTDPVRLHQILCHIVGNSVKFTEKGEVEIETNLAIVGKGKLGIEFIVTDTGAGLTGEERKNLFAPFAQADSTSTRKSGGLGLGLALSRRLAEKLGGDLTLSESNAGGCSFRITIADMDADYLNQNKSPPLVAIRKTSSKQNIPRGVIGAKILVVDDAPDNQLLLKTILDRWGIICEFAANGIEGVEKATKSRYDLILMDIQMPLMDGNEAMRTLRRSGYTSPIVALTAHAMLDEKAKCFDAGCDDFLVKPISKPRLLEIVETYAQQ